MDNKYTILNEAQSDLSRHGIKLTGQLPELLVTFPHGRFTIVVSNNVTIWYGPKDTGECMGTIALTDLTQAIVTCIKKLESFSLTTSGKSIREILTNGTNRAQLSYYLASHKGCRLSIATRACTMNRADYLWIDGTVYNTDSII